MAAEKVLVMSFHSYWQILKTLQEIHSLTLVVLNVDNCDAGTRVALMHPFVLHQWGILANWANWANWAAALLELEGSLEVYLMYGALRARQREMLKKLWFVVLVVFFV